MAVVLQDIDENSLLDCVPQNPDGYIFSIVGGTVDQRAEWTATLRKVSHHELQLH